MALNTTLSFSFLTTIPNLAILDMEQKATLVFTFTKSVRRGFHYLIVEVVYGLSKLSLAFIKFYTSSCALLAIKLGDLSKELWKTLFLFYHKSQRI